MSMQSIKEKTLLIKFAQSMGQPVDPAMVEEVRKYEELQEQIKSSVKTSAFEMFQQAPQPAPLAEKAPTVVPATQTEVLQESDLVARAAKSIKAPVTEADSYQQPSVPAPVDIKAIKDKIKFLEQWVGKISATGPGGGAGEVYNLDMPTILVTSNSYVVTKKDYYIGVNYAGTVNITLPTNVKQGRYLIIKDESGRCSQYPIVVHGNVDNDPDGFILKINNGGIQMIYRNGWRIV
jgi:hypothetical protein